MAQLTIGLERCLEWVPIERAFNRRPSSPRQLFARIFGQYQKCPRLIITRLCRTKQLCFEAGFHIGCCHRIACNCYLTIACHLNTTATPTGELPKTRSTRHTADRSLFSCLGTREQSWVAKGRLRPCHTKSRRPLLQRPASTKKCQPKRGQALLRSALIAQSRFCRCV